VEDLISGYFERLAATSTRSCGPWQEFTAVAVSPWFFAVSSGAGWAVVRKNYPLPMALFNDVVSHTMLVKEYFSRMLHGERITGKVNF